jgi:acetyl esterase/lipase
MTVQPPTLAPFVLDVDERAPETTDHCDYYLPDTQAPSAAIVFVHGMPFSRDFGSPRLWPLYRGYGSLAAQRGWVGAVIEHSLGELDDASSAARLSAAIAEIRAHPRVDGDRLALWHFSGGAPMVAPYLTHPPQWLRCVALTYPKLCDFIKPLEPTFRPISAISPASPPVVLTTVGRERPELAKAIPEFRLAAEKAGADLTVIDVPDGHHGFDAMDHTDQSRAAVVAAMDAVSDFLAS